MGKCFEKLITDRITWHLHKDNLLSADQYGFTSQKYTEDALIRQSNIVQKGKMRGFNSILIFLDIEGAFDNAWWPAILNLLMNMKLPHNVFNVVADFLKDRLVELFLGATSKTYRPQKGCPQGSVSGPRLWNIIINDLLQKIAALFCCEIIAFADDLLICVQCKDLQDVFSLAQDVLNFIWDWSVTFKLRFNHAKSKVMLIDKRNTTCDNYQLLFNENPLEMVKEIKYLGVLLDSKFNWKKHICYISNKCEKLILGLNRIARNNFGVKSNVSALIYRQGIVPFVSYGCRAWGLSLKKKINSKILRRIQRRILLRIISGYRTISYNAVFALAGFPPLDIFILSFIDYKDNLSTRSCSSFDHLLPLSALPHPSERLPVQVLECTDVDENSFSIVCYTDGSKIDDKVGFAYVIFENGVETEYHQFRIRNECTVFLSELLCINFTVKWIISQDRQISKYLICTDSLSSLYSLKNTSSSNDIIVNTQQSLKVLLEKGISVYFTFVRGHVGIHGNERADWLAKNATRNDINVDVNIPKSYFKKMFKSKIIELWNHEYLTTDKGYITKKFFPNITNRIKNKHIFLNFNTTQFLSGHGNFNTYLERFKLTPSNLCSCDLGVQQSVFHLLFDCPMLNCARKLLKYRLESIGIKWPPNCQGFVTLPSAYLAFNDFIDCYFKDRK